MGKRIITESEVKGMTAPGELVVDGDTLITPAALDAAFSRGLNVIYARGEARERPASGSLSEKERRMLRRIKGLSDGDYVLQIRNGRFRIFRIGEEGVYPDPGSRTFD